MQRKLFTGMDRHGRASEKKSMADVAKQMAASSASSADAFHGISMALGRLEEAFGINIDMVIFFIW